MSLPYVENIRSSSDYLTFQLKPLDSGLIRQAVSIYDESLGQKYIPESDLLGYLANPIKYIVLGLVTRDVLLGIMLSVKLDPEEIEVYDNILTVTGYPHKLSEYNVGLIRSVAVRPEYRHRGIGTKLTIEAMSRLESLACNAFFAVSWVSNRPDSSQGMFEKLNYRPVAYLENYWTEDSIQKGYNCPNCGHPCHCTAIYYLKTLTQLA